MGHLAPSGKRRKVNEARMEGFRVRVGADEIREGRELGGQIMFQWEARVGFVLFLTALKIEFIYHRSICSKYIIQ